MTTLADKQQPKPNLLHPVHCLAFGFGAGCVPKAPGTMGTLVAVVFYLLLLPLSQSWYIGVTLIVVLAGIGICGWSARQLGVHDHPGIVWDEIAGYLITMIAAPKGVVWIVLGFGLFRLFDIIKPWPIAYIDRKVGGGLGIMLDDVVAGLAAFACMQLIQASGLLLIGL